MTENLKIVRQPLKGFDDYEIKLGDWMRGERATLGKSLLDVQRDLRISASYISAIENCNLEIFDSPAFIAGYIKSYAKYLGISPEIAFKKFCIESGHSNNSKSHPSYSEKGTKLPNLLKVKQEDQIKSFGPKTATTFSPPPNKLIDKIEPKAIGSLTILLVLIISIGYGGFAILREIQQIHVVPSNAVPLVLYDLDPIGGNLDLNNDTVSLSDLEPGTKDNIEWLYKPKTLDVPVFEPREGPIASLDPSLLGNFKPKTLNRIEAIDKVSPQAVIFSEKQIINSSRKESIPSVMRNEPAKISIFAIRPAWVRIKEADDTIILERIMQSGEEFTLPPETAPHKLHAGMSGSVYFAVNGILYGPAGQGTKVIRNLTLSEKYLTNNFQPASLELDPELRRVATKKLAATFTIEGMSN